MKAKNPFVFGQSVLDAERVAAVVAAAWSRLIPRLVGRLVERAKHYVIVAGAQIDGRPPARRREAVR